MASNQDTTRVMKEKDKDKGKSRGIYKGKDAVLISNLENVSEDQGDTGGDDVNNV
jgi:hypothetical protein